MMSAMATKRLLLIDGHSMAYRAFFALPAENFTTAQGQHTNAIYGFATMLISLLKDEKPTHVAVAFDVSRKTFRTEIFPEYKANRAKTPDELRSQMSYLHELVKGFGISQFEIEGFEADDIIATITKRAEKEGAEVLICTGDRDSFQLVTKQTTVLYPKRGVSEMARMTPDAVQEKYGMSPEQFMKEVSDAGQITTMVAEVSRAKALAGVLSRVKVVTTSGKEVNLEELAPKQAAAPAAE